MKTTITLNKQDIEEIIAQRFGVDVERVVLSASMEMVGYGQNEHEEQTIAGVVNLNNPGWPSQFHLPLKKAKDIQKYIDQFSTTK